MVDDGIHYGGSFFNRDLIEFLENNAAVSKHKHGSRKGYSTKTQLIMIFYSFDLFLGSNGQVGVIYFFIIAKLLRRFRIINNS